MSTCRDFAQIRYLECQWGKGNMELCIPEIMFLSTCQMSTQNSQAVENGVAFKSLDKNIVKSKEAAKKWLQ